MALCNPTYEKLLSLKLTGMAEAYLEQQRLDYHELGFDDRLALLLEREQQARSERSYRARLRQARLREQADIADVFCTAGRGIQKQTLLQLAAGHWINDGVNILLVGKTGVGKTYLACALANQACRQDWSVLYHRLPDLFAALDQARAAGKKQTLLRRLMKVELLVLDDWGLETFSVEGRRDILEIIEARTQRRSTIIASQLPVGEWHRMIGESTIADAILDRTVHYAHHFELRGESQRREKRPPPLDREPSPKSGAV